MLLAEQPLEVRGCDLEGRAGHAHRRERVRVVVGRVARQQTRQVSLELVAEARKGVRRRPATKVSPQELASGGAQFGRAEARTGVKADELGVGGQDVSG